MKRFVLAIALTSCGPDADLAPHRDLPAPPGPARPSEPARPRAEAPPDRGFVGVIAAAESADVVPRFAGVLSAVHVRPGDRVSAGQVVAELDPRPLEEEMRAAEAAAQRAQAEVRKAHVDVEDARRRLTLQKGAVASGLSPASALEEARLAVERARAAEQSAAQDAKMARSRANTARDHLAETRLAAPFDGTVALRFRDAGATIEARTPIVKIVKQGELRLRFAVPPQRARDLPPGTAVTATVETIATPIAATVRRVSPALDPASELILIEAELTLDTATAADLRPGLGAAVRP